ncbi:zinc finger BED domain-containing protein 5-like [Erpetoichthys calabaricus]|uniref:zinc finger BED domain-containing protein 5-like n=1 Tax=Erpetoichthys calabaricus TaxID=27687 RepID=UPI00109F441F|nr:zinc finger BED domain-containing protein 5-like [Erpetoichthys calabaricus]
MASVLKSVTCSDNTVQRRIKDISEDLIQQVVEKIIAAKGFSMQLDESTDISGKAQLVIFVRVPDSEDIIEHILLCQPLPERTTDSEDIIEHILLCQPLPERTTGEEIFKHIDDFFCKHDILWFLCVAICSDGAAAMTGRTAGSIARARQQNNLIVSSHCILHRHALASKRMSEILHETLNDAVKIINYIKNRPLNARLFRQLCQEIGSDHKALLFHTEVRRLSRRKVLMRIFELRDEVYLFLKDSSSLAEKFEDVSWVCRLGYLADVFKKLNELNVSLQGYGHKIFTMEEKVSAFHKKLYFWMNRVANGNLEMFPILSEFLAMNAAVDTREIQKVITNHLKKLYSEFVLYFAFLTSGSNVGKHWITSPFNMENIMSADLSIQQQEILIDMTDNQYFQEMFKEKSVTEFRSQVRKEHDELSAKAITALLPFGSTYLCEKAFSSMTSIKTKPRNCLYLEYDLVVSVSTLSPRIQDLMEKKRTFRTKHGSKSE